MSTSRISVVREVEPAISTPSMKESPARWLLLVLLFTGMLIGYAHRGALSVAAPFMAEQLNLSKARIGVLLSAFFWIYAFSQMPAGWFVDRFAVRRAYSLGFLFWSLTSALTGLAGGFVALLGLRVSLGAGQAIMFPATSRAVANWFRERERGTVTGIYLTGVRFGTALISWVGALFLAKYSWRSFFLVAGLVPLVWVLCWSLFLRNWETPGKGQEGGASRSNISFIKSFRFLRHRSVLGIFLGFFSYDYAWYVFITWLPGYLMMERGFKAEEMGVYSAAMYLFMSVIIVASGALSDWLVKQGRREIAVRKIFILVGFAIGCLIVPAGLVDDKITAVWLLTVSLCGLGICSPNTWTLTQAVCEPKIVGTVTGVQNFGGNLGGILAPALTGFIAQVTHSFALALALAGAAMVFGMATYWFLVEDRVEASLAST